MSDEDACGSCGAVGERTAPVSVAVVFVPGIGDPYPAIPAEDYAVCRKCDAAFRFVDKVQDAHPVLRNAAGRWTRAVLVFKDGEGMDVRAKRSATAAA